LPGWLVAVLTLVALLLALKILYVAAVAASIRVTRGALFVSTSRVRIHTALNAITMRPGGLFVDLGCGDGRALREASRRFGVMAMGYEVNPLAYGLARILSLRDRRVRIVFRSFWGEELKDADVVFCYLFPDVMERLAAKLERELKRGAQVISCNFPVPGWEPQEVLRPGSSRQRDPIYVYRIPAFPAVNFKALGAAEDCIERSAS